MNSPEAEKGAGALERIKEFAGNVGEALHVVPSRQKLLAYGAATVAAFGVSEMPQNSQAEARTPIDDHTPALVGAVVVKETIGRPDGGKDTTVKVSRVKYDPNPDDNRKTTGLYTALSGSIKQSTTTYKADKYNPLRIQFKLPDAYGCGIPKQAKFPVRYNPNIRLQAKGRPSFKKLFGKKPFNTEFSVETTTSTGDSQKDMEIIGQNPYNIPFEKTKKLKKLRNRPNKTSTAKTMINLETCYPISGTADPQYDKHKAAGYSNVPYSIRVNYHGAIKNGKKGAKYASVEVDGKFELVDVRAYNADAYASAN